jgi:hypothetical protein
MKMIRSRILFAGLLGLGLSVTLLIQPAQSSMVAQRPSFPTPRVSALSFGGVWSGIYQFVGGNGKVQLYVNPAGILYGSFASDHGLQFAQISGQHRANKFHMILTPPPVISEQSGSQTPKVIDATANWDNPPTEFMLSDEGTGHPHIYRFKRVKQN